LFDIQVLPLIAERSTCNSLYLQQVASRDVFIAVGVIYFVFGIIGKVSAVFLMIPYPVLGGALIVMFGMFNGVVLSNLQVVSLNSSRNLAIMGTAILFGLMIPHWMENNPDAIQTGENLLTYTAVK
jgi:nucleobase transporter 1/2